jgi:uncharacterized membrane protein YphA (DoxX/SURF4 family)
MSASVRNISDFAPLVLRVGLAVMFLWFASNELMHPQAWSIWVPAWVVGFSGFSAIAIVTANGIFELLAGTLLLLGIYTRPVAVVLFLHMAFLVVDIGINAIGMRDFALAAALLALALDRRAIWSVTG